MAGNSGRGPRPAFFWLVIDYSHPPGEEIVGAVTEEERLAGEARAGREIRYRGCSKTEYLKYRELPG